MADAELPPDHLRDGRRRRHLTHEPVGCCTFGEQVRQRAPLHLRQLRASDREPVVSEALVATARAAQEERDRAALARYEQVHAVSEQIVQLLRSTPWDRSDLARIRAVLDDLDQVRREQEDERQRDEQMGGSQSRRRLGTGSLEAKLIRGFGPYLYYRFREGGRHRSMYVGKVAPAKS